MFSILINFKTLFCLTIGNPKYLPSDDRGDRRGWPNREAYAEGRERLPQVQGQAKQLAQGQRCGHEPRGAPPRRR